MTEAVETREILLEAGTNELEVLVFCVGPTRYGVNVGVVEGRELATAHNKVCCRLRPHARPPSQPAGNSAGVRTE